MVERYKFYTCLFFGAMWVLLCYGFVRDEFIPALAGMQPFANLLCDIVFLFLGIVTLRSRRDIFMVVSFLLIAMISKYLNHQGMSEWLNGMREYIGLLFTIPFIRYMMARDDYAERFTRSMDRQFLIFLYIQAVCLVWQVIRYGAGDEGGGSMGYGHSGIVSTLIYVISFYLITKHWNEEETYIENLKANRQYILLLLPTFLNETKISFVYLLAYFVLLMKIDRKIVLRFLLAVPLFLLAFVVLGWVYLTVSEQKAERLLSEKFYTDYFIGEDIYDLANLSMLVDQGDIETDNIWVVDLPRLGRFVFLPEAMQASGGGMMLGAGVGQFKGNNYFSKSAFSRKYAWLLNGSTPLTFAWLVQLGIVGMIWFFVDVLTAMFTPNKAPLARNLRLYLLMVLGLILIYQDQFRLVYYCAIIFYIYLEGLQPEYRKLNSES